MQICLSRFFVNMLRHFSFENKKFALRCVILGGSVRVIARVVLAWK